MQNTTDRTSGRHRGCQPHPRIVPIGAQVGWPSARLLATLTNVPFDDPDGVFESKWDGFRMVASIEHGRVTLYSRNGKIISDRYLPVARALEKVKRDAVIDGELVALDAHGISRFQLLQNALRAEANCSTASSTSCSATATDLRGLLLLERKDRLRCILPKHPLLALSEHRPEVPCIQARSDRADEECCARICLQGYPHQRSVPGDHRYADGCGHVGQGARGHERHLKRSVDRATWPSRGNCLCRSLALQPRRKLRNRSRAHRGRRLHRTLSDKIITAP